MRLLRIGLALWLLACAGVAQAALTFPALTGRVVDTTQIDRPGGARAVDPAIAGAGAKPWRPDRGGRA